MSLLARLRCEGIVNLGDPAIDDQRKALRKKWDSIVSSPGDDECDVFLHMWALFEQLPPKHALYLQPLFRTPEVLDLLRSLERKCLTLERVVRGIGGGTSGSGHTALAGTLGVGKTYIMRGFALVVAALCAHCIPITFDFEGHGAAFKHATDTPAARGSLPPISLILRAASEIYIDGVADADSRIGALSSELETADVDVTDSSVSPVGSLLEHDLVPLLILDEINLCCFTDDSTDPRSIRGRCVTAQLQRFGRQRNTFALISGSSLTFREQLFAKGKWSSSPSLNGSLFTVKDVTPLRDPALLRGYTSKMFPSYGGTAANMAPWQRLLSLSGGVGRAIETVMGGSNPGPRFPPAELVADPYLRVVLTEMLGNPDNAEQLEAEWPLCIRVSEVRISSTLTKLGCLDVTDRILKWRDDGVLYASGTYLELLYPHVVNAFIALLRDNQKNVILVQYQLAGISGSVGAVAEGLFRPGIRSIIPVDCTPPPSFKGGVLTAHHRVLRYETPAAEPVPFVASKHLSELVSWKAQVGLEDFMLHTRDSVESDEDDDGAVSATGAGAGSERVLDLSLSAWQCKAPHVGTITTWNDYNAAVASVVESRRVSQLDPIHYLDHAIVKAQWGMALLTAKLQESESHRIAVHPFLLFLTTTAVLDATCKRKIVSLFSFPVVLLRAACETHVSRKGMSTAAISAASTELYPTLAHLERSPLQVKFVDGVEWTDAVSNEFIGAFNTPMNRATVAKLRGEAVAEPTVR